MQIITERPDNMPYSRYRMLRKVQNKELKEVLTMSRTLPVYQQGCMLSQEQRLSIRHKEEMNGRKMGRPVKDTSKRIALLEKVKIGNNKFKL